MIVNHDKIIHMISNLSNLRRVTYFYLGALYESDGQLIFHRMPMWVSPFPLLVAIMIAAAEALSFAMAFAIREPLAAANPMIANGLLVFFGATTVIALSVAGHVARAVTLRQKSGGIHPQDQLYIFGNQEFGLQTAGQWKRLASLSEVTIGIKEYPSKKNPKLITYVHVSKYPGGEAALSSVSSPTTRDLISDKLRSMGVNLPVAS